MRKIVPPHYNRSRGRKRLVPGDFVSILDIPGRNGMMARVIGIIKRHYIIEILKTKENLKVQRGDIRKNTLAKPDSEGEIA